MADYDLTKIEKVCESNVLDFLTHIQFMKQKGEIEIFVESLK